MEPRMPTLAMPHIMQTAHGKSQGDSRSTMDVDKWFKIWAVLP